MRAIRIDVRQPRLWGTLRPACTASGDDVEGDDLNRLVASGLNASTALDVMQGRCNEAFEVARAQEAREVALWCKGRKNIPTALNAVWDRGASNIYLALDGAHPADCPPTDFVIIEADVSDVDGKLTFNSSRDRDPWHRDYKRKSCGIAYRWQSGLPVTPPLLIEFQGKVHIEGGMHRYHLAKYYLTARMPFLVRRSQLNVLMTLIPSAVQSTNAF
jgi:hypothetical protein